MESHSEYQKTWRRFRRNRPAVVGLWFVAIAVFVALFGYVLAPDNSPNANAQIPEVALQAPGFSVSTLWVTTENWTSQASWYSVLFNGRALNYKIIPVEPSSLKTMGDSIHFQYFGKNGRWSAVPLLLLKNQEIQTRYFPLGTDKYGRCILSRLILGFRVSLLVGLIAVFISLSIGVAIGAAGGYFGGRVDDFVMLVVNTVWSIPTLLLVFAVVLALGRGIGIIFLAVGLTMWVDVARVVRGQVLTIKQVAFVEAAQSMGLGPGRILLRHILPNLLGPVMVVAAGNFATAILVESGLSYLGFGVQPPAPSWGTMLNENYGYALGGKPLLALAPALAIAFTVLAFNLVGNGLRDALDVKN
ncbi:MAG: ABC transporter permease [Saprospiraceae bacterium]|nr:ABC transporter permease [Saprospiraceae bacterium]